MSRLAGGVALVTGGTRGLGRAAGIALGRAGCQVVVTHRWGSIPEEEVVAAFVAGGAPPPMVLDADVAAMSDLDRVLSAVRERHGRLDVFVSNVCVAARGGGLDAFRARDLVSTLDRSSWPVATHVAAIRQVFGRAPSTTIAMSSDGPDHFYPGYDYVAMAKAALESLVSSLAPWVAADGGRIFALRTRQVDTQSLDDMFAAELGALWRTALRFFLVSPEEMGDAVVALADGSLDGLHGGVLCADRGAGYFDSHVSVSTAVQAAPAAASTDAPSGPDGQPALVIELPPATEPQDVSAVRTVVDAIHGHRAAIGALPRRVVALQATHDRLVDRPREAVLDTAIRYFAATYIFEPMSLNLVRHRATALGHERARRTAAALGSGRLDHVRGQVLTLHDH